MPDRIKLSRSFVNSWVNRMAQQGTKDLGSVAGENAIGGYLSQNPMAQAETYQKAREAEEQIHKNRMALLWFTGDLVVADGSGPMSVTFRIDKVEYFTSFYSESSGQSECGDVVLHGAECSLTPESFIRFKAQFKEYCEKDGRFA